MKKKKFLLFLELEKIVKNNVIDVDLLPNGNARSHRMPSHLLWNDYHHNDNVNSNNDDNNK